MSYIAGLPSFEKSQMLGMEHTFHSSNKSKGLAHAENIQAVSQAETTARHSANVNGNMAINNIVGTKLNVIA